MSDVRATSFHWSLLHIGLRTWVSRLTQRRLFKQLTATWWISSRQQEVGRCKQAADAEADTVYAYATLRPSRIPGRSAGSVARHAARPAMAR